MIAPEGSVPGQTINIVVPAVESKPAASDSEVEPTDATEAPAPADGSFLGTMQIFGDRARAHAKNLDETYKISDKVVDITSPGINIKRF